jgi:RNA:NAD 2'-phosphotransferase (TPT1/KptA family)
MLKLYHGTSSNLLPEIMEKGLLPRRQTGISNWSFHGMIDLSSHPDKVYLADTPERARNMGYTAVKLRGGESVVVETQVDEEFLVPDEDSRVNTWERSLKIKGTCAHNGQITPNRLTLHQTNQAAA